MKSINNERGQALIIFALAAIGIFGIVGLAIDGSAKFSDRRHAQNAADASALAAAHAKLYALSNGVFDVSPTTSSWATCPPPIGVLPSPVCEAMQLAGLDRANDNGYDDNPLDEVAVYSPPISGYYQDNEDYVQVIVTSRVNTTFARVIGWNQTQNTVEAVALAKEGGALADGAMIISYDPDPNCSSGVGSGGGSVDVSGSSTVNLNGGGIFLNSDEVCGFAIPNCADLNIIGGAGISSVGGNNIDQDGCADPAPEFPNQESIAIPDDIYWPDIPPECNIAASADYLGVDTSDNKGEWLIHPGYYEEFPQGTLVANKQHIYMESGVYCIDPPGTQDLSWSPVDFVSLNGSTDPSKNKYSGYNPDGVTLYIKSGGGFAINANNPTYLDASTTGDLQGYLIVLEGTHTSIQSCSISGGSDIDINGLIFAPYCDITVNGDSSSTAVINAQLIGWDLKINGGAGINFNYDPYNQVIIKNKIGLMR